MGASETCQSVAMAGDVVSCVKPRHTTRDQSPKETKQTHLLRLYSFILEKYL